MKWLRAAVPPFGVAMRREEHSRNSLSKSFQEALSYEERFEGYPVIGEHFLMYELQLEEQSPALDDLTTIPAEEDENVEVAFSKAPEKEEAHDTPIEDAGDSATLVSAPEQSAPLMVGPDVATYEVPPQLGREELCPSNYSKLSHSTACPQVEEQSPFLLEATVSSNKSSFSFDAKDTAIGEANLLHNRNMAMELGIFLASALIQVLLVLVIYFCVTRFHSSKRGKEKQQAKLNRCVNTFTSATSDEFQTPEAAHPTQKPALMQKEESVEEFQEDAETLEDLLEDLALAKKPAPLTSLTALLAQSLFSPIKIYQIPAPKQKKCKDPQEVQDHHELVHFCSRSIVVPCDPLEGYRPTTLLGGIQERVRQSCFPSPRAEKRNSVRRDSLILNTLGLPVGVDETNTPTSRSSFSLMASSILTQNRFFPAMTSAIANAAAGKHQ